MTPTRLERPGSLIPSSEDATRARDTARLLARHEGEPVHLTAGEETEAVALPRPVARLIQHLLSQLAAGHAVTVLPLQAELTTQQAADLLNVSRPYLVGLLEGGQMPFHRVGTHRRVHLTDLLAYREQLQARQQAALTALAEEGQDLGLF